MRYKLKSHSKKMTISRVNFISILIVLIAVLIFSAYVSLAFKDLSAGANAEKIDQARSSNDKPTDLTPETTLIEHDATNPTAAELGPQLNQQGSNNNSNSQKVNTKTQSTCQENTLPFQTEYRDDDNLAKGESRVIYQGKNGFVIKCAPGSDGDISPKNGIRVEPVNAIIARGTGVNVEKAAQAEAERKQRYSLALANCVESMKLRGVDSSRADAECRQMVKY